MRRPKVETAPDKAAPDVRFTVDVDCIVNVITRPSYYAIAEKLRQKGFKELISGDHPICCWDCNGILIDVMPIDKSVLGFSNKWYKDAQENAIRHNIADSINIKVISAPFNKSGKTNRAIRANDMDSSSLLPGY